MHDVGVSYTEAKQKSGKQLFQPGDPRINRAGRPKSFDEVRSLAVKLGSQPALDAEGNQVVDHHGHPLTYIGAILFDWLTSRDFKKQDRALAYAFGAPPTQVQLSGKDGEPLSPLLLLLQELRGVAAGQLEEPAVDGEVRLLESPPVEDDPSI